MKVRLANKSVGCFALLTVLVSCSIQAAANELPDQIRITALDADGERKTLSTSRNILEQFALFKNGYLNKWDDDKEAIDLTADPRKDVLSYRSLSKLLSCVERNPENYVCIYEEELLNLKSEKDIIALWRALDYLIGPKHLRYVVANRLEEMNLVNVLDKEDRLSASNVLENCHLNYLLKVLANGSNGLAEEDKHLIDFEVIDLTGTTSKRKMIYCSENMLDKLPKCYQVKIVDLSHNAFRSWDRKLSKIISRIAPDVTTVNLSHNCIRNIERGALDDLPERCKFIDLSHNKLEHDGVSPIATDTQRDIKIDLSNNNIDEREAIRLNIMFIEKMSPIHTIRHEIARDNTAMRSYLDSALVSFCVVILCYAHINKLSPFGPNPRVDPYIQDPGIHNMNIDWSKIAKYLGIFSSICFNVFTLNNNMEFLGKEYPHNRVMLNNDDLSDDEEPL